MDGQADTHGGALMFLAGDLEGAAETIDARLRDLKSESRATDRTNIATPIKSIENQGAIAIGDADAEVGDFENQQAVGAGLVGRIGIV